MDTFTPMDCGSESLAPDDLFSLSSLLTLDNYADFSSPSAAASSQLFSPLSYSCSPFSNSSFQQTPTNWPSLPSPNASSEIDRIDPSQKSSNQFETSSSSPRMTNSRMMSNTSEIPRPMSVVSVEERMLRALSVFKDQSLGGGILAQVWMPVKHGNSYVLTTAEQPFLFDKALALYREISRTFTFSAAETPGLFPGLPGRVFISRMPEWTSNVQYYNRFEYLRGDYAIDHQIRGSLAVPVFDPKERSCCAVLELVTTREKPNFDVEMESVCSALQAVNLRTTKGRVHLQNFTKNQRSVFSEILDVLRTCCHAHMLPLALTWVPFSCDEEKAPDSIRDIVLELNSSFRKKTLLCVEESACYINDTLMKGFLHACTEHCLEKGQGIAGKALKSNHPFFSPDIKGYDILEYPLAHHARKYGLQAAVAIRLRSTYTEADDYILEFFLPINCMGSSEQQELLNSLSSTMQRICKSLRTVSDAELAGTDTSKVDVFKQAGTSLSSHQISAQNSQSLDTDSESLSLEDPKVAGVYQQYNSEFMGQTSKKRSASERDISLSVLQQYFSGSLKDAAKSIGVCPTTLKRICRLHGIARWPSRKINKVNRSLKKIQSVINSVQGVEGALKYDATTGCLVAAVSTSEKSTTTTVETTSRDISFRSSAPDIEAKGFVRKLDFDNKSVNYQAETLKFPDNSRALYERCPRGKSGLNMDTILPKCSTQNDHMTVDVDTKQYIHLSPSNNSDSSSESASSCQTFRNVSRTKPTPADTGPAITVKATYKEDNVRFKFVPSMGVHQLYEEISARYRLLRGTFQLKYMDDEEEWVMLADDSDLHECIEVLESMGSRNLKLTVRDIPILVASSGASNNY